MTRQKPETPEKYAGAIQHFDAIPARYRLETYASEYRGDNTWERYVNEVLLEEYDSERMRQTARLGGESWLEHMASRPRHHALATTKDVDAWCQKLLDDKAWKTCYEYYFVRIYDFYDHLKSSCHHPHLYNPFLLAAIEFEATRHIWMHRLYRSRVARRRDTDE